MKNVKSTFMGNTKNTNNMKVDMRKSKGAKSQEMNNKGNKMVTRGNIIFKGKINSHNKKGKESIMEKLMSKKSVTNIKK